MPWDWILLIAALLALTYGALAIRREKDIYIDNALEIPFHDASLKIPHWWALEKSEPNRLQFHRADTHYDWKAVFEWIPEEEKGQDIADHVKSMEVEFDPEVDLISTEKLQRREGWATQGIEDRIHLDLALIKRPHGTIKAYSQSSPLNGCVEGPYFDEVIRTI